MGCRYRTGVLPGIPGGEVRETLRRHGHPRWSPLLAYPLQWSGASYRGPLPIQHYHISMSIPTTPTITQPAAPPFQRATFPPPPPPVQPPHRRRQTASWSPQKEHPPTRPRSGTPSPPPKHNSEHYNSLSNRRRRRKRANASGHHQPQSCRHALCLPFWCATMPSRRQPQPRRQALRLTRRLAATPFSRRQP